MYLFMQARHKIGAGGAVAPQFLAEQLTLSQPGGADYAHHSTTGCLIVIWSKVNGSEG